MARCGACQIEINAQKKDDKSRRDVDKLIADALRMPKRVSEIVSEYRAYFTSELLALEPKEIILKFDPINEHTIIGAVDAMCNRSRDLSVAGHIGGCDETYVYEKFTCPMLLEFGNKEILMAMVSDSEKW